MADGKITSDEYDALYKYVLSDLGYSAYGNSAYWRYVTVSHPCYYVSYSVSLLGSFQLFVKAENESLEAAVESYTKLITFTDEHSDYDYSEVLEYAGLNDFRDEQLFIDINALLKKK
jgi:oligoendopeptidase F